MTLVTILDLFVKALSANPDALIICPSNPFVSVDPILSLPGIVDRIRESGVPVLVVSNIVSGMALKGPAAKMMSELGMPQTAFGVAEHYVKKYGDLVTGFVLDQQDAALEPEIASLGLAVKISQTVMQSLDDRVELAGEVLAFAGELSS